MTHSLKNEVLRQLGLKPVAHDEIGEHVEYVLRQATNYELETELHRRMKEKSMALPLQLTVGDPLPWNEPKPEEEKRSGLTLIERECGELIIFHGRLLVWSDEKEWCAVNLEVAEEQ